MDIRSKYLLGLVVLCLIDVVIPLPISGAVLIYVILKRPPWFLETVEQIYRR